MHVQMSVARAEHQEGTFRGPVVILADMDKSEMDEAVLKGLQGAGHLEVPASILRTSNQTRLLSCSTPCVYQQHNFACLHQLWSCLFTLALCALTRSYLLVNPMIVPKQHTFLTLDVMFSCTLVQ